MDTPYWVVIVIAIRDTSPILLQVGVISVVLTDKRLAEGRRDGHALSI
jgi:hypothetical protein